MALMCSGRGLLGHVNGLELVIRISGGYGGGT